jgi:DHA3 family macrolide efflux protein-like MFS transporter
VLFFTGTFVSMLGSEMTSAALQWVVLRRTGSEEAVGRMLALSMLPGLLFLPFTGVLIDRSDRRHLAIALDAGRALVVASVPITILLADATVAHLYLVAILVGFCFSVYWANASALVQEICGPGEIAPASAFFAAAIQGGTLIGGALVGFTFNHIGLGGVLLVNTATYAISACCLLGLRRGRHIPHHASPPRAAGAFSSFRRDLRDGLSFLRGSRAVLRIGAITVFVLAGVYTLQVVTAPLTDRVLDAGAVGFGYCIGAWGLGAMAASQVGLAFVGILPERVSIAGSLLVVTVACAATPHSPTLPVALLCFFLMGYGRGSSGILLFSRLLESVPREMMGRVQTTISFFGLLLRVAAMWVTGVVAHQIAIPAAFAVPTLLWFLATGFALPRWPPIRRPSA